MMCDGANRKDFANLIFANLHFWRQDKQKAAFIVTS